MRTAHLTRSVGFALAVGALIACRDLTAPEAYTGAYVLAKDRLPVHLFTNEFGAWFATADTIRFGADGQGSETGLRFLVPAVASAAPMTPISTKWALSFRVVNGRLEASYPCPPNANCAPPPHMIAVRTASGLHVTYPNSIQPPQDYVALRGVP